MHEFLYKIDTIDAPSRVTIAVIPFRDVISRLGKSFRGFSNAADAVEFVALFLPATRSLSVSPTIWVICKNYAEMTIEILLSHDSLQELAAMAIPERLYFQDVNSRFDQLLSSSPEESLPDSADAFPTRKMVIPDGPSAN